MQPDWTQSPVLESLKQVAMRGGLNHPVFDQGILASIKQVESDGYFMRGGLAVILALLKLEELSGKRLLTDQQVSEGNEFLKLTGWTIDEGAPICKWRVSRGGASGPLSASECLTIAIRLRDWATRRPYFSGEAL